MASRRGDRMQEKVCVITGSSSGHGRGIALEFARQGAHIVCSDLQPQPSAAGYDADQPPTHELIAKELSPSKAIFVRADASEADDVVRLAAKAVETFGRIDVWVNNAGVGVKGLRVHELHVDDYDKTMKINARSCFLGCKHAAGQMLKQEPHPSGDRGWIVNISSICGLVGTNATPAYNASKGAVEQLTKVVALDYAADKIHCNSICPGYGYTGILRPVFQESPEWEALIKSKHPWPRIGDSNDVAKAALFLASEDSAWVTGTHLVVDGGYTAA